MWRSRHSILTQTSSISDPDREAAVSSSCGEGLKRAQPVNLIFLLRALAARKSLHVLTSRRRAAAEIPAIRSRCSEYVGGKDQVAGRSGRSVPQSERQLFVPANAKCVQLFNTRYLKAAATLLMKELSAATRAISLRPLRKITHRSWYRCLGS